MEETMVNFGPALAIMGAALAAALGGIGSCFGVGAVGQAASGVTAEKPEAFGKLLVLGALPGSQGIYGLVGAFLVLNFFPNIAEMDIATGWKVFGACLPLALTALFSGIFQGKVAAAGTNIIAKNPAEGGKAIILAAIVETFAILGLLATFLLLNNVREAIEVAA